VRARGRKDQMDDGKKKGEVMETENVKKLAISVRCALPGNVRQGREG